MTPSEEKKLFDALRSPVIYARPFDNLLMEKTAMEDLRAITPAVNDLLQQAENRGRLGVYLEIAAERMGRT